MRSSFKVKASNVAAKSGGGRNANEHLNLVLGLKEKLYLFKNVQKSKIFERIPKTKIEKISFFFKKWVLIIKQLYFLLKIIAFFSRLQATKWA